MEDGFSERAQDNHTFLRQMRLEHTNCDLCGSGDYRVRYRKPDDWLRVNRFEFPVVECSVCGLVYVNPRPDAPEMYRYYPTGYHQHRNDGNHRDRYVRQYEYIADLPHQRILDVGCAQGDWLDYVLERAPSTEAYGVDTYSECKANAAISFFKGTLPDANLPKDSFDLVTSWAVMEHVYSPTQYFSTVEKVLRPGGAFVFLVTNSESNYGKYAYKEDVPRHLYHFSERTLAAYGEKCGLHMAQTTYETRFWDATGHGSIRHRVADAIGVPFLERSQGNLHWLSRAILAASGILDSLLFAYNWEARFRRSGILVATMLKP